VYSEDLFCSMHDVDRENAETIIRLGHRQGISGVWKLVTFSVMTLMITWDTFEPKLIEIN